MSELIDSVKERINEIVELLAKDVKDNRLSDEQWLNLHTDLEELRWTLEELEKQKVVV